MGSVANQRELIGRTDGTLLGQWQAAATHCVAQSPVDFGEGEQFRAARHATPHEVNEFSCESGVVRPGWCDGHGVRRGGGKGVSTADPELAQDSCVRSSHVVYCASSKAAVEDHDPVVRRTVAKYFPDQLERYGADGKLVWIGTNKSQVQLVSGAGTAVPGEVEQKGVFGEGGVPP
jgi:hypothetical protein